MGGGGGGGGGEACIWGAYNWTKKNGFQIKLHSSANQNTFSIYSLFKLGNLNVIKKQIHFNTS